MLGYTGHVTSILLLISSLSAGITGKIVGRVTIAGSNEPLIGANVILAGTGLGAATDVDGHYLIMHVPPNSYNLQFSVIGYRDLIIEGVRVKIDLTTTVDAELAIQSIVMDAVVAQARAPIVQSDVTYSQANISAREIDNMPVEEFEDILALQAGVVVGAGGSLHVRGGRRNELAYFVDGMPVTDPMFQSMGVEIENNAIQELQIISGTFNAEYGQAMSGIVNIVTKQGDFKRFHGTASLQLGDYYTTDTTVYEQPLAEFAPRSLQDLQFSLEGPVMLTGGKAAFFLSGRLYSSEGHDYGIRKFTTNSMALEDTQWELDTTALGNGAFVPMAPETQSSYQAKVTLKPGARSTVSINYLLSNTYYRTYSHKFKWNPDGDYKRYRDNESFFVKLDQGISERTYIVAGFSQTGRYSKSYVYSNPIDTLYNVDSNVFSEFSGYRFYAGGTRMGHAYSDSRVRTYKFELVSQISDLHQVQAGFEHRATRVHAKNFTIQLNSGTNYQPEIDTTGIHFDEYTQYPMEYSLYAQDKVEYNDLVLNLGLRYDLFNVASHTPADPEDLSFTAPMKPIHLYHDENGDGRIDIDELRSDNLQTDADRLEYWFVEAPPIWQVSPRLAIAYPVTDLSVLHFSYGHFLQIPQFQYLYANPDFDLPDGGLTRVGNAALEAERTAQYEVGFKQQVGDDVGVTVTGFYKDIRNLLGTRIVDSFIAGTRYALYSNREYGNIQGITLGVSKRPGGLISGHLDYTYSVAEGSASDPSAAYTDAQTGNEPEKQLVPLDWDQRHTLNITLSLQLTPSSSVTLIGNYGSGLPYTPELAGTRLYFENSERKPPQYNLDLKAVWRPARFNNRVSLSANVYNLLDRRNEVLVYDDTGRAGSSLASINNPSDQGLNTLDAYLLRPDYYSAPRQIKIGISTRF